MVKFLYLVPNQITLIMKKHLFTSILCLYVLTGQSQTNTFPATGSAGIGTITPNSSAALEITSTNQGVLVSRMTKAQRDAILTPATGLLIYQTNSTPGFYYYSGTAWTAVTAKGANTTLSNLVSPTAANQDILPGTTNLRSLGSGSLLWKDVNLFNLKFSDGSTQTTAFIPYIPGTGIGIAGSTISNTAPDQVVSLTGSGATSVTGTYPNFTVSSTDNNTTYSPGTGISISGTTITNSSPDQTVSLTGTNGITITGTYPSFTLNGASFWKTTGNSGLVAGTNFIGTTDAVDLVFKTGNTEFMRIANTNSRLGIGTTSPLAKVHIKQGSSGTTATSFASGIVVENSTSASITIITPSGNDRSIFFGDDLNSGDGGIVYSGLTNSLNFRTNGGTTRMTLNDAGDLDIAGSNLNFGTVEQFSDAGSNVISCNSDFINASDGIFNGLGTSTNRWVDVWAADGSINTSDIREKTNIKDLNYGLDEIMKLRPVTFSWIKRPEDGTKLGLIAQELQKVLPEVVRDYEWQRDEVTGEKHKIPSAVMGVMYDDIIPVLVKGIQELSVENDELKSCIEKIESTLSISGDSKQEEELNQQTVILSGGAYLQQNVPNPFDGTTAINYYVPDPYAKVQMQFMTISGDVLQTVDLSSGKGSVTVKASELAAGTYQYSLLVNGRVIGTKKMMLQK